MRSHGPPCGCIVCATAERVRNFVFQPNRDPRLAQVAATRLRLLHSYLLDLSEGVSPAFELPGEPLLKDLVAPPPGVPPDRPVGVVAPGQAEGEKTPSATTAKSKPPPPPPAVPGPPLAHPLQAAASALPREREEGQKRPPRPSTSRPRSSKGKSHREGAGEDLDSRKSREKKHKRSRKSRSEGRRRSRRSRERSKESSRRSRSRQRRRDKRPITPEVKREPPEKSEIALKEEPSSSVEVKDSAGAAPVPSREEGRRAPRPPSVPPHNRKRWEGPIPAHRRDVPPSRNYWPKSKGVKRREKNRAFREANYGRGWQGDDRHRRR